MTIVSRTHFSSSVPKYRYIVVGLAHREEGRETEKGDIQLYCATVLVVHKVAFIVCISIWIFDFTPPLLIAVIVIVNVTKSDSFLRLYVCARAFSLIPPNIVHEANAMRLYSAFVYSLTKWLCFCNGLYDKPAHTR